MPAPPRARQPLPPGRPPRPGPAPPYALRPPATGHRAQRRHHQHDRQSPTRLLLVGALVVGTVVVGAWWFLGRGPGSPGSDFVSVERRFATAAAAVHSTPQVVQRFRELQDFNDALDAQAIVMEQSLEEFDRIASEEEGDAADIAHNSVSTAKRALRAVSAFRDAIVTTNDLADAQDALSRLDAAVDDLDAKAARWKRL